MRSGIPSRGGLEQQKAQGLCHGVELRQERVSNIKWASACVHNSLNEQKNRFSSKMHEELKSLGIPSTLILDASVGYVMTKVDCVIMGAEGVMESGGIVNKVI